MQTFDIEKTSTKLNVSIPFFKKKFLKGYSKIHELKLVSIGLASPQKIQSWAEKELPNGKIFGEVTNANTFHYRTFQPTKGGLFCERIFGPLKDFECACGKRQKPTALESKKILEHKQTTRYFCSNCDVEFTWSIIRRYQLGYIKLNAPVTHLWYLKTNPSYLSIFFDMKRKDLEGIVYCTDFLTLENVWKLTKQKTNYFGSVTDLYTMWLQFKNFKQKRKNFDKHVLSKKEEKLLHRLQIFSQFENQDTSQYFLSKKKNWKMFNLPSHKKNSFATQRERYKTNRENFFPLEKASHFKIFENIQKQKQQVFISFLFEQIFQKNLKKTYGNDVLKLLSKEFCFSYLKTQKPTFHFSKNIFFPNSFFEKNLYRTPPQMGCGEGGEKKMIKKLLFFFFFFFNFANSLLLYLNFETKEMKSQFIEKEYVEQKKKIFTKKNSIFLLILVSFLKKKKSNQNFLLKKKQFKLNFIQLFHFFFFPSIQNQFDVNKKEEEFSIILSQFLSKNAEKIFLNKKRKKFLLDSFEKDRENFTFLNKKKNLQIALQFSQKSSEEKQLLPLSPAPFIKGLGVLRKTKISMKDISLFTFEKKDDLLTNRMWTNTDKSNFQKKSIVRVFNKYRDFKKEKISKKNQKKFEKFLQSGIFFKNLEKEKKSLHFGIHGEHKDLLFQHHNSKNFKKSFSFFDKKTSSSLLNFQNQKSKNQNGIRNSKGNKKITKQFKNPLLTISYNFLWKNDSDWKYFVYYNSLFFSEFEDIAMYEQFQTFPFYKQNERSNKDYFTNIGEQKQTQVGAGILEKLLTEYTPTELKKMIKQHQILLPKINKVIHLSKQMLGMPKKESLKIQKYIQKREHIVRRLKFLRKFFRKNSNPTFMILRNLPVLPPDLRPILKLQNQIAASDLNRFYQRILYRNERLKKFSKDSATNQSFELRYAQRLLQEAVDNLIQNGKGGVKPETNSRGIPLKSLSEILKGKQGRFRQYLLGKRVDYSGRSVIVVGPKLKLYECGLPKEMAFELFLPFLIQQILQFNLAKTVIGAKNILKKDSTFAFHLLKKIMKNIPVLLNRAPTLHRLGFQAFLPKLIEGRAILLHPMVCPGFNADFDGDQMAVHVPLTVEARTEAWKFMLSTNNFINSATGDPVLLPTQDMVLGCYYLTTDFQSKSGAVQILNSLRKEKNGKFYNFQKKYKNFLFFSNCADVFSAYQRKNISLHSPIWIRWNGIVDFGNESTKPVEIQVLPNGSYKQILPKMTTFSNEKNEIFSKFIRTTPGRIFMNFVMKEFQKDSFIHSKTFEFS